MVHEKQPGSLTPNTLTTLGVMSAAIAITATLAWSAASFNNRLANIERILAEKTSDTMSRRDLETYLLLLEQANVGRLTVPRLPE